MSAASSARAAFEFRLRLVFVLATLTLVLSFALSATEADAAVQLRGASCNSFSIAFWPPYSIDIDKPAGTLPGDLMVATVRTSGWYSASSGPSGWTESLNDGASSVTWYKIAGASEPSSYTFGGPSGGGAMAGGIVSFSGVDLVDPIDDAQQSTSGTAAAIALPAATASRAGSMRYSTVTSGAARTSIFQAGLSEDCDETISSIAMASAHEATGVGAVASRTDTRSGTGSNVSQTFVINPVGACGGGSLSMTTPTNVTFPGATLSGFDQTAVGSTAFRVNDSRGTGSGWNVSGTSTTFSAGARTLPPTATRIVSATPLAASGNCSMPVNAVALPVTLPAGAVAPTATKLFGAAPGTGAGPIDLTLGAQLTIPSSALTGSYASTWTFTLSSGP